MLKCVFVSNTYLVFWCSLFIFVPLLSVSSSRSLSGFFWPLLAASVTVSPFPSEISPASTSKKEPQAISFFHCDLPQPFAPRSAVAMMAYVMHANPSFIEEKK